MARVISIVNQKGGTGKSACTANLAVGLAQKKNLIAYNTETDKKDYQRKTLKISILDIFFDIN